MIQHLSGFAPLAARYEGFIIDLWGVIHDGVTPYPGAIDCLSRLKARPVLLLSNAPRRVDPARQALRALGIEDTLYTDILTSGEATWMALRDKADPWFTALGKRVYHIGPDRDRSIIEGLELVLASSPNTADFVLNTGPDDHRDPTSIADFTNELDACLRANLKMVCANPDMEIVRAGVRIMCAGSLAAYYESNGGSVRSIGKPDPAIYDRALHLLGLPRSRVLGVGDSLRTDIAGAAAAGIDSAWIVGGLHGDEMAGDQRKIEAAAFAAGLEPEAALPFLAW